MTQRDNIKFRMSGIKIEQFAILSNKIPENGFRMSVKIGVGADKKNRKVIESLIVSYIEANNTSETPCLILQIACLFDIEPNDWESMLKEKKYIIPKKLLAHFAMHTFGTARGILFSKTEGTEWNKFVLPPHNVDAMITDDLIIE